MKQFLIKLLKGFVICALVALIILLVVGMVLGLGWPWWMAIFVLVGLVGLGIAVFLVRKIWLRRREQHFVHKIIEQDEAYLRGLETEEKEPLKELQDRWKAAIDTLRRSYLKKYGNPLYALPWYLIIGESGSGKTTAIKSARLSSPFAEVSRTSGISGTRNIDWWFFEQAIILDTAGRYAIPIDESRDKEEWQKFLDLLVKYRKRESLNGLIVTIAADKLLQADRKALEEDGRDIRRRIDELMRVLGAKFPVYVMVTKCDLIQGMTHFCGHLPEKRVEQAMGCLNQDLTRDVLAFQDQTNDTICDHLRDFRLLLLHQSHTEGIDPGLLLFPEEFEKLKPGLAAFIMGAFQENPYQETPILRGIFSSSGRQEGTPYSHFLRALGLIGEGEVLPGTDRGLFLRDFFTKILPKDRRLFAPTQRALEWQRISRNLGLSAWIALGVAVCGLLSFSFVKNLKTLREVSHELLRPPTLTGVFSTDAATIERFRETTLKAEKANRGWWVPRFGLNESRDVETELKKRYTGLFSQGFLEPIDHKMEARIRALSGDTPDEAIGQYVEYLTRRIHLLKARLDGKGLGGLKEDPQPSFGILLDEADRAILDTMKGDFGDLYLASLIWRPTPGGLHQEMNALQAWLQQILTLEEKDLKWLVVWTNHQDSLPDVKLEAFWEGSGPLSEEVAVERAFTREGKKELDGFWERIEAALPNPQVVSLRKQEFDAGYQQTYLSKWLNFATHFPQGKERLQGREEWQHVAAQIASGQGPYSKALGTMALELDPVAGSETLPAWVNQLRRFQLTRAKAMQDQLAKDKGPVEKAAEKLKNLITLLERHVSKVTGEPWTLENEALSACSEYQKTLTQIRPATESRTVAYDLTAQAFKEDDPVTSQALFFMAHNALNAWKSAVSAGQKTDEAVWSLIRGPLDDLWSFVVREAGCTLQTQWTKKVLVEIEGVSGKTAQDMVLGDNGLAWKFVDGPAGPFIDRVSKKGYVAKSVLGEKVYFEPRFLKFLSKPPDGGPTTYQVTIEGLPTGSKPDAAKKPRETRLKLKCEGAVQSIRNINVPVRDVFMWSPDTCGDVILEIDVGNVTLIKKYPGFREFLLDFRKGVRRFSPRDFPREKDSLRNMGITSITVRYRFKGHGRIINLPPPVRIPRKIAACWDQ
jgi:type VI secretion system protein ImpL